MVLGEGCGGVHKDPLTVIGRRCRQSSLALDAEGAYVDATRLGVTPTQVLGCHDEGRLVSQSVTQVVQLAAQVGQRLCVGRVRPEQFGDALPGLG